jgi:uncharacterized tellurite resistance protein B-like protein
MMLERVAYLAFDQLRKYSKKNILKIPHARSKLGKVAFKLHGNYYIYLGPKPSNPTSMNFTDILKGFKQGKGTARSHMKNLIEMAAVDGNFDSVEYDLLKQIAKRNNISENQLKSIHQKPTDIIFELPEDKREKFDQFYDLVHMMSIDKSIHNEEMKLCNLFAVKFGYSRERSAELIRSIQSNISNNQSHTETYKRLEWMINK